MGWGYKPLEETMGVNYYNCPIKYLEMVPEPDSQYAKNWRIEVKRIYAEKKALSDTLRKNFKQAQKNGKCCVMSLRHSLLRYVVVTSLKPLRGSCNGGSYKISKSFVGETQIYSKNELSKMIFLDN